MTALEFETGGRLLIVIEVTLKKKLLVMLSGYKRASKAIHLLLLLVPCRLCKWTTADAGAPSDICCCCWWWWCPGSSSWSLTVGNNRAVFMTCGCRCDIFRISLTSCKSFWLSSMTWNPSTLNAFAPTSARWRRSIIWPRRFSWCHWYSRLTSDSIKLLFICLVLLQYFFTMFSVAFYNESRFRMKHLNYKHHSCIPWE